ncbi:MAG: serine/threonine protein kinase [Deltaproteobacteria bacterium]|nr:serine/threonine protein kinase [Deltaproteobacteria bacterium]
MKTLRDGRYVVESALGEGGQATTYVALDTTRDVRVAVKRFRVGKAKRWKDVELAEREAKTLSQLSHPRLPRYVEHFEEGDSLVLVMELLEGTSLAALRKEGKLASLADIERLLDDAQSALDYLHSRVPPVIHRDIKPGNVIRRNDGSFAFVDFGSVRDRLKPAGGSTVVGTFGYMAPEQFQGRASPATDVFGVGATVLAYLTGAEPEDLPHKGLAIDVRAAVPASTPQWLVNALERMLEPDPDRRAPTIADALVDGTREAHRSTRPPRRSRPPRRDRPRRVRPRRTKSFLGRAFGHLFLALAQLTVLVVVGLLVPALLFAMSPIFGAGLRRAASRARAASRRAREKMQRAGERLDGGGDDEEEDEEEDRRGEGESEPPRARVADDVLRNIRAVTPEQAQELAIREAARRETDDPETWADEKARTEAARWEHDERVRVWDERQRAYEEAEEERRREEAEARRRQRKIPRGPS